MTEEQREKLWEALEIITQVGEPSEPGKYRPQDAWDRAYIALQEALEESRE